MAQRFRETTGIDPFTIDQTEMSEHSAPEFEHPLYQFVQERRLVSRPTVFQNARGELWTLEKGWHDVTLFHPRTLLRPEDGGRPDWLRLGGIRGPYRLPVNICGTESRCLVRARVANESTDASPVDQLELRGQRSPTLMLPDGDFIIEVESPDGRSITTFRVNKVRNKYTAR